MKTENEKLWDEFLLQTNAKITLAKESRGLVPATGAFEEYFDELIIYDVRIKQLTTLLADASKAQLAGEDCLIWRLSYQDRN